MKEKIDFQKQLAELLYIALKRNEISKKKFADMMGTSKVFATNITKSPGKIPSPSRLRNIILILSEFENIEKEVETLLQQYAPNQYEMDYYIYKLKNSFSDLKSFIKHIKQTMRWGGDIKSK
jgi:hypothetical protein